MILTFTKGYYFGFFNSLKTTKATALIPIVNLISAAVWVLEVKNFDGEYKNTGEDWEYRAENIWKPL